MPVGLARAHQWQERGAPLVVLSVPLRASLWALGCIIVGLRAQGLGCRSEGKGLGYRV
jgi:hypothetical protein